MSVAVWGRDLSAYDPEGPLPDIDPDPEGWAAITRGRVRHEGDQLAAARKWRAVAEAKHLSIRQLVIEMTTSFPMFLPMLAAEQDPAVMPDLVPDLVADLVGLGVRVHAVEPGRISLEDRLLDILRTNAEGDHG